MSQEIIKVLEYLGEKLGIAIDWTTENVLPYAEQLFKRYVALKLVNTSIGTLIGVALVTTAIILTANITKGYIKAYTTKTTSVWWRYSEYWKEVKMNEITIFGIMVASLCALFSIPILVCNLSPLIEWIIIPEIPFAKEIASLLGTTV